MFGWFKKEEATKASPQEKKWPISIRAEVSNGNITHIVLHEDGRIEADPDKLKNIIENIGSEYGVQRCLLAVIRHIVLKG